MKDEKLFRAIGECDDKFLTRSEKNIKKKNKSGIINILPIIAVAAILGVLCINAKDFELKKEDKEGRIESETSIDGSRGGCGREDEWYEEVDELEQKKFYGLNQDDYNRMLLPVMPLTLNEENQAISAIRHINYDFKSFENFESEGTATISDYYYLTNNSQNTQTIKVKYPYISSMEELLENMPVVTLDYEETKTEVELGRYWCKNSDGGVDRVLSYFSAEGYEQYQYDDESTLLENFDYSLLDEKIIVYEYLVPESGDGVDGCYTIRISGIDNEGLGGSYMKLIENNTFRVNMLNYNLVEDKEYYGFYAEEFRETKANPMLVFYGTEPEKHNYMEQGYESSLYSKETQKEGFNIEKIRYETTFGEVLDRLVDEEIEKIKKENGNLNISKELFYDLASAKLCMLIMDNNDGVSEFMVNDYEWSANEIWSASSDIWEDDISMIIYDSYYNECEYFITKEIEIPAGETVVFGITYDREGEHDSYVEMLDMRGRYGFDNIINLWTNLSFESQNASIEDYGYIEIVDQNYGFDIENDIKDVALDMNIGHYYLVVKRIE